MTQLVDGPDYARILLVPRSVRTSSWALCIVLLSVRYTLIVQNVVGYWVVLPCSLLLACLAWKVSVVLVHTRTSLLVLVQVEGRRRTEANSDASSEKNSLFAVRCSLPSPLSQISPLIVFVSKRRESRGGAILSP